MGAPLLRVDGLDKRFGGFQALSAVSLSVDPGERVGLIGPNGSGKSTLVNCICGTLRNDAGTILFGGEPIGPLRAHQRTRLGIARSFQLPRPFFSLDLLDNMRVPLLYGTRRSDPPGSGRQLEARGMELLARVGLEARARARPADLSQVELRKLELARAMAARPRLLIADEAMAGLSRAEVEEIVALLVGLNETGIAIVLIEHIMSAVMRFSQRLIVLVSGQKIADGKPAEVLAEPEVERSYLGQ